MGEIRKSRQNIQKVLCFQQNVWKVSKFDPKHRILVQFLRKVFEKFRMWTKSIRKVPVSDPKHFKCFLLCPPKFEKYQKILSKHLKIMYFWSKTLDKYFYPTHHKNLIFAYKVFEKFCTPYETFKKYLVWTQNSRQVFDLSPKHLKSIWCRSKVFDSIDFRSKNFGKYRICT